MWRRPVRGVRETLTFCVVLIIALVTINATTDRFGDGTVLIALVIVGAVGSAWLWYDRRRRVA
jgi:hypothetical protein